MIDLWLAIGLSSIIIIVSLFYSFRRYSTMRIDAKNSPPPSNVSSNSAFLFIPILFLLLSILFYASNPSVELHENWLNTQIETKNSLNLNNESLAANNLVTNKSASSNLVENNKSGTDIQSMLLGLRTLVHQEPNNAELWFMLAESYFQLSMIELADESMKRAIRLKPSANWYVAYAQILALRSSESDLARAISFLKSAVSLEPNHQSAMLTMGFLYLRQQKTSQAIDIWSYLANKIDESGGDSTRIRQQIESITAKSDLKATDN